MLKRFSLQKYYLDAVSETGEYFIGYFANVRYRHFSACYSDTVHSQGFRGLKPGPSLSCTHSPETTASTLTWQHPALGVAGKWHALSPSLHEELLSTADGQVDWNVLQPGSTVTLKTASGQELQALGYCEHITLTIPPWKLGLKELVWGRFVSEDNSVVWLEWKGIHNRRLLFRNGRGVIPVRISEDAVTCDAFSLAISPAETVRAGYIGPDILAKVPMASDIAPLAMLQVHEHKKLGRGVLDLHDGPRDRGWIIHETVVW